MSTTPETRPGGDTQLLEGGPRRLPVLPTAVKDARASRDLLFSLRHFHLGNPVTRERLEEVGDDLLPALLHPFRDHARLRYDYPLFLFPTAHGDGHQKAPDLACPLAEWLQRALDAFAPGPDGARVLRDHLPWLEHQLRQELAGVEGPVPAASRLVDGGAALQAHLKLNGPAQERLAEDLARLLDQVPAGAQVLGYGRYAALHLMVHAIRGRVVPRRARLQMLVHNCIRGLQGLRKVEWGKSMESIEPARARDSVGPGAALFNADVLSEVMDHARGTREMSPERRARIEGALAVLQAMEEDPVLVRFVHPGTLRGTWLGDDPALAQVLDPDPCARATALFDQEAARLAKLFAAVRIAQLEINGIYDPAIHDPWFANFHWEGFTQDELLLVPTVIAVESADRVAGEGLRSFSRLLSSGRPVQIMIRVRPYKNPGAGPDEDPFQSYRLELGYLGISHRQAAVAQSSPARHQHLLTCCLASLDATRTSLHIINTGLRTPGRLIPLNAWLVAGAGIEGRAHPFFHINPQAGDYGVARMDFAGNPQAELDWPVHPFRYRDENGHRVELALAFTFADYALLIERLRGHFRLIPPGCESAALVPMQDYLAMDPDEANQRVPFVWGVDGNGLLHRLVVSRELAMACLDRLNFWHALQELAGVRNRHVELAIERTQTEERAQARADRERLQADHAAELERVRAAAAGEAMQRLADLLLGMDLGQPTGIPAPPARRSASAPATSPAAPSPPRSDPPPAESASGPPETPPQDAFWEDPWIDTPLCTSCNDCLKINPLLFRYTEERQAVLGDLGQASYAQLVEAAEICPARCIHPGKPWNPAEPGLPELIERAAPFNRQA